MVVIKSSRTAAKEQYRNKWNGKTKIGKTKRTRQTTETMLLILLNHLLKHASSKMFHLVPYIICFKQFMMPVHVREKEGFDNLLNNFEEYRATRFSA